MKYIKTFEELSNSELYSMINKYGNVKLKEILKYDKDINKRYDDGYTLLMLACKAKSLYLVRDLIKNNADVNLKNDSGETALMIACSGYSSSGDLGYRNLIIKELINAGANVNLKDLSSKCALLKTHDYDAIKILISAGADLNSKDKSGKDIFDYFYYDNISIEEKIQKDFPKKYKEYQDRKEMEKDIEKYNL